MNQQEIRASEPQKKVVFTNNEPAQETTIKPLKLNLNPTIETSHENSISEQSKE